MSWCLTLSTATCSGRNGCAMTGSRPASDAPSPMGQTSPTSAPTNWAGPMDSPSMSPLRGSGGVMPCLTGETCCTCWTCCILTGRDTLYVFDRWDMLYVFDRWDMLFVFDRWDMLYVFDRWDIMYMFDR